MFFVFCDFRSLVDFGCVVGIVSFDFFFFDNYMVNCVGIVFVWVG